MPINIFDLPRYTPDLFEFEPLKIFDLIDSVLSTMLKTIGIILYSTQRQKYQTLELSIIIN